MRILEESIAAGLAAVILWVGYWTILVPQMTSMQVWQDYESIVPHIFLLVSFGYMPVRFLFHR